MNKINLLFSLLPRLLDDPREDAGGHAERLQASGGEVIPGRSGEYIILQDGRLIEKARTYDEATRKGKVVKRHPEAKVEIQCSGVTAELK